jgi:hypothetical protein
MLNLYAERWLMISWATYFLTLEMIKLHGNGISGFFTFGNTISIVQSLLIIAYVICEYWELEEMTNKFYVILTILSWLGLMNELRIFNMF